MKLFYSPGACSLAVHIALQESGLPYSLEKVDIGNGTYKGGDYAQINPKGSVPVLQTEDKELLTENAVILQYVADRAPDSHLIPKMATWERYRCQEWLNFISSEVHKTYSLLWNDFLEEIHPKVKDLLAPKFDLLSKKLEHQNYLMGDTYTVADSYLFTILRWYQPLEIDMKPWPALMGYMERVKSRPATQTALKDEGLL